MLLKQCRVPRTFRRLCFFTNSCASCSEPAGYNCSVLYSKLPAQFVSLPPVAQVNRGESKGLASMAEESLINVLLFTGAHFTPWLG